MSLIDRQLNRSKHSSKSPVRPSPGTQWRSVANLNKSAVVEGTRQAQTSVGVTGMTLPTKLQRMKERVKRERSQNTANDENRDGSLYGRQKLAGTIEEETQRLRESYNQHRKPSQHKDRSISGVRSSIGGLSNGGNAGLLHKQNFKEDPFDDGLARSRDLSGTAHKDTLRASQQIARQLKQQSESQQTQMNRFKRTTQKSQQTLANYQVKYQKLEQNYRKFTSNLVNPNQSDQIITDLKFKTGIHRLMKYFQRFDDSDARRAFKLWRLNSGVAFKQFQNQEKTLVLAKAVNKMQSRSVQHHKLHCYQRWKQLAFLEQGGSSKDRITSVLSEIILSSQDFNRCVENDSFLAQILHEKIARVIDVVSSDLMLYQSYDGREHLKTYHLESGEQIDFNCQSLYQSSLLGNLVFDSRLHDQIITVTSMLQRDPSFNKDIDLPVNKERILEHNQAETNVFNKVRHLSLAMIKLQQPSKIGILRLFFSCPQGGNSPTQLQMQKVSQLAKVLPLFLQRIFDVRSQINSLALTSLDQGKQIQQLDGFNRINLALSDFQSKVHADINLRENKENLVSFTKHSVETFFRDHFEVENVSLRQIVRTGSRESAVPGQEELLLENSGKDLVRLANHNQENAEVMEDFLDHRKEYYVHQISVCPRRQGDGLQEPEELGGFTFVFQIHNFYESHPDRDASMVNLSTSLTSNMLSMSALRATPPRRHLDEGMKQRLCYFLRFLCPVLSQAMQVASEYIPCIERLQKTALSSQMKYELQLALQKLSVESRALEERDPVQFYLKLSQLLTYGLGQIVPELVSQVGEAMIYLNRQAFQQQSANTLGPQFQAYLTDSQTDKFYEYVVRPNNLDEKRQQKYLISEDEGLKEVSVCQDVFDVEIAKWSTNENSLFVTVPLVDQSRYQTVAVIAILLPDDTFLDAMQAVEQELTAFTLDFLAKRGSFAALQERHDQLLQRLKGERVSQETKDLVEQHLIVPFVRKQSLKALGDGVDALADRLITNLGPDLDEPGQEVSQIAFIGPKAYIEDVRLLSTYSQANFDPASVDKMLLQSFQLKQQIVYEDDLLEKVVVLFPLMSSHSYKSAVQSQCALILRFILDRDEHVERKVQNIHAQLINAIAPILDAALSHEVVAVKPTLAVEKLSKVIDKYKFAHYREIIYFMRDLKAKNVFNFSRSRLYEKLAKSKRFFDLKDEDDLFDCQEKHLNQNQKIQALLRESVVTMNKFAFAYKQSCFKKFVIGTRMPLYANMSKKKKKAVSALAHFYQLVTMRELFLRYAINAKMYKYVRHPKTKYLGAAQCIFRNFRVIRERLAFLKLKKNLNMQLRDAMTSYRENDKDLFIQLNQILVSSQNQQGGLEGGFAYALSEIFAYLKSVVRSDQHIAAVGARADDSFVGHVDEMILTLKTSVYLPSHSIDASNTNQKLKILMCDLREKDEHQVALQKGRALHLSFDSNIGLSQQEQLLSQIAGSQLDRLDQNDIVPSNEFENELQQSYSKYIISLRKDLIHQMLEKSNGITFNFQNVQQSLSDIFLGQQSLQRDQNIGNRYAVVRRSKSALIIPLLDVSQQSIIGSFELYRHHQQAFTEEIEERFEHFAKLVGDFCLLYGQLQQHTLEIGLLKWQIQKAIRPVQSLSSLLKNVYVNGPGTHFTSANHVLPIILLNQSHKIPQDLVASIPAGFQVVDSKVLYEQKQAFFYQFKDNHIYSFEYEGTFIEELLDNGCILEMCRRGALQRDEDYGAGSQQSSIENIHHSQFDLGSNVTGQNPLTQSHVPSEQEASHRFAGQRHCTIQTELEKIKTVTGEQYKHIIYYPIFDIQDESRIIAVFEVAYKRRLSSSENLLTEEIQSYLDQFRSQLDQFRVRLGSFTRNLQNIFQQQQQRKVCKMFQVWKQMMIFMQYKESFQHNQFAALQDQEHCYSDYVQNLESCHAQIRQANEDKVNLQQQITQYSIEKKAKLKFLATSLLSTQNLFKRIQKQRAKEAFLKWQYNVTVRKIAETAFNRVLELNHRHSKARLRTGVFLLQNIVEGFTMQTAFNLVLQAAHLRRFESQTEVSPLATRSRSRSRGACNRENSFVLNNITSLLSPRNLKKIEKANLYKQQINSFYAPMRDASDHNDSSVLVNAHSLTNLQNPDLPAIQLRPHEVTKQTNSSVIVGWRSTSQDKSLLFGHGKSPSRHALAQTQPFRSTLTSQPKVQGTNPYRELNVSQVELTQDNQDYSPIITTSKYELRKIYDPHSRNGKSYYSDRHQESTFGQRQARSVEPSSRHPQRKLGAQPLEHQLVLKQKQLEVLKRQITRQGRAISIETPGTGHQSSQQNLPISIETNHGHFRSSGAERLTHGFSTTGAESKTGSRLYGRPNGDRRGQLKKNWRGGSGNSRGRSRRAESTKSKGLTTKEKAKYAAINGRDVSPPVRDRIKSKGSQLSYQFRS